MISPSTVQVISKYIYLLYLNLSTKYKTKRCPFRSSIKSTAGSSRKWYVCVCVCALNKFIKKSLKTMAKHYLIVAVAQQCFYKFKLITYAYN